MFIPTYALESKTSSGLRSARQLLPNYILHKPLFPSRLPPMMISGKGDIHVYSLVALVCAGTPVKLKSKNALKSLLAAKDIAELAVATAASPGLQLFTFFKKLRFQEKC